MEGIVEGDEIELVLRGQVLWLGDKQVHVAEWMFDLASLHYPSASVRKIE